MNQTRLEKKIGYIFRDKTLLERALSHSSYVYENPGENQGDNEILEFLGDSVVGLSVAHFYYSADPKRTEGELSKLKSASASTNSLAEFADRIGLDKAIRLGHGEERSGGRKKKTILADAFEALVGAVYLDGGFEAANEFMKSILRNSVKPIREEFLINNCKSALQEHYQKSNRPAPVYRTAEEKGPAHKKVFYVEVSEEGMLLAKAKGHSKKAAEQSAAYKALKKILGRRMKVLTPGPFPECGDD
jgi:ribonuclease III